VNASRNGFALITVLWLVAALAVLLSVGMRPAYLAARAAENRLGQRRALWAARGCVALVQARRNDRRPEPGQDSVGLGPATWCRVERLDWDERINPNFVDSLGLARVLADSVKVASLLDWIDEDELPRAAGAEALWYENDARIRPRNGPIAAVAELRHVRGFEREVLDSLELIFTVRGDGTVSPNRASVRVLSSITALSPADVARLIAIRSSGRLFTSVESVYLALGMDPAPDEFRELVLRLSLRAGGRTVRVHGWSDVGGRLVTSRIELELVPVDGEVSVTGVEVM
jgi:type II secretory pathway component PulK